jgi:hypothetical protein
MNAMVEQYRETAVHGCGGQLKRFVSDERPALEMIFCAWCGYHVVKGISDGDDAWQHVDIKTSERASTGKDG